MMRSALVVQVSDRNGANSARSLYDMPEMLRQTKTTTTTKAARKTKLTVLPKKGKETHIIVLNVKIDANTK